jgi:hypothetical protein
MERKGDSYRASKVERCLIHAETQKQAMYALVANPLRRPWSAGGASGDTTFANGAIGGTGFTFTSTTR